VETSGHASDAFKAYIDSGLRGDFFLTSHAPPIPQGDDHAGRAVELRPLVGIDLEPLAE